MGESIRSAHCMLHDLRAAELVEQGIRLPSNASVSLMGMFKRLSEDLPHCLQQLPLLKIYGYPAEELVHPVPVRDSCIILIVCSHKWVVVGHPVAAANAFRA